MLHARTKYRDGASILKNIRWNPTKRHRRGQRAHEIDEYPYKNGNEKAILSCDLVRREAVR